MSSKSPITFRAIYSASKTLIWGLSFDNSCMLGEGTSAATDPNGSCLRGVVGAHATPIVVGVHSGSTSFEVRDDTSKARVVETMSAGRTKLPCELAGIRQCLSLTPCTSCMELAAPKGPPCRKCVVPLLVLCKAIGANAAPVVSMLRCVLPPQTCFACQHTTYALQASTSAKLTWGADYPL